MKNKITIAAAVVVVVAVMVAGVVAAQVVDTRPPWENEDGIWDMSQLPDAEGVVDSTGTFVGVVETRHYETDLYPLPVLGPNGELVGHLGENGFWALGEPEPLPQEDAYTVVEEFDAAGTLRMRRTIHEGSDARTVIEEFNASGGLMSVETIYED